MRTIAHRTKLWGRPDGLLYLGRAAGLRRMAYNWALAESKRHYAETGKTLTGYDLVKLFNAIKDSLYPWCREFSKWIPQLAQMDCWAALKRFFKTKKGFPRFKRKGKDQQRFQVGIGGVTFEPSGVRFHLAGNHHRFRITRPIRFPGRILRTTFVKEPDGWYGSFLVEVSDSWPYPHRCETQASCGVDFGIATHATIAAQRAGDDETQYHEIRLPTRRLDQLDRRTRRRQRSLARKQRGSANYRRAARLVALTQQKARRVRSNAIHHLTSWIVENHHLIGVETLAVANMVRNPKLARSIQNQAWGQAASQLEYKAKLAGATLVRADRWFPSSKRCSCCGHEVKALPLQTREWACPSCGVVHARDRNAAENLRSVAQSHWETLNGCGGDVRPIGLASDGAPDGRTPAKQQSESSPVKLTSVDFAGSLE